MNKKNFIVLDLETTGLSPEKCEIIEIGITEIKNNKIVKNFSKLVKPSAEIPYFITNITKITNEMVKDAKPLKDIIINLRNYLGDNLIICHNARFDIKFINYYFKKFNLPEIKEENYLCTLEMVKSLKKKGIYKGANNKLNTVAKYYGIKLVDAHRAYADTLATAKIYLHITSNYPAFI